MKCLFTTKLDYTQNTINIKLGNDLYYDSKPLIINIYDDNILNYSINFLFGNNIWWYRPSKHLTDFKIISIEIKYNDEIIFTDFHRVRDDRNILIKKQAVYINKIGGMGDCLCVEPVIRKISNSYKQKIRVYTHYPELFINNPYVDSVVELTTYHGLNDYERNISEEDRLEYHIYYTSLFYTLYGNNDIPHWTSIDFRQLAAIQCGFSLTPTESKFNFYPDNFINIPELPEHYVCLNPSIGSMCLWNKEKWQLLIDKLNENNINVVIIGKKVNDKSYFENLKIKKGIDLSGMVCQNTLSQVIHIIEKSDLFISELSGLSILATTTSVNILIFVGPWDIQYQIPLENNPNVHPICGSCDYLNCFSNMYCSVSYKGTTNFSDVCIHCHLNLKDKDRICSPDVNQVYEKILKICNDKN